MPSDDPLLSARSAIYSQSFTGREGEAKQPSAITSVDRGRARCALGGAETSSRPPRASTQFEGLFFLAFLAHFSAILLHTLILREGILFRMIPRRVRGSSDRSAG